jgi:FXSXX-COOH protein
VSAGPTGPGRTDIDDDTEPPPAILDVTQVPLQNLLETDSTPLANAMRRLQAELAADEDVVSGHSDSVQ